MRFLIHLFLPNIIGNNYIKNCQKTLVLLNKDKYTIKIYLKNMNRFNIFIVLSAVAVVATMFGGTVVAPSFAVSHENMTMGMDNSTMPMDHMGNMTMSMDNSTGMMDNSTMQ